MECIAPERQLLEELIRLVEDEDLSELSIETANYLICIRGNNVELLHSAGNQEVLRLLASSISHSTHPSDTKESVPANWHRVTSSLTGVFYRQSAPDAEPFVEIGNPVEQGQVIGMIEAMKVFNEILADVDGTVVQISAENDQVVDQGDTLIVVARN